MKIKLSKGAVKPTRATNGSAGYDLYSMQDYLIGRDQVAKIKTGVFLEIPEGFVGLIYARSGLATKNGVRPANCVAVIDSDYRGELLVPLRVDGAGTYNVSAGERIAQLIITPVFTPELEVVDELSETSRGAGGFGSTGKMLNLTREEAEKDILAILELKEDAWFKELGISRTDVYNHEDPILKYAVEEHIRCVNRYGCDRKWSAEASVNQFFAE